jgi:hypothetical protein
MCQLIWSLDLQKAQHSNTNPAVFCRCCNQLHDRWDLVRYEVEREHGMISGQHSVKASDSCIIGVRLCDINKPANEIFALGEDARMQLIGPVVLLRFPVPSVNGKHRPNTFIPNKITETLANLQHKIETDTKRRAFDALMASDADEETKLQALVSSASLPTVEPTTVLSKKYPHPSAAIMRSKYAGFINYNGDFVTWADQVRPQPPRHWRCMRCYNYFAKEVHYAEDCPSLANPEWIPMNRRSKPVGIPRSLLMPVNMENIKAVATAPYIDDNGKCWIRK